MQRRLLPFALAAVLALPMAAGAAEPDRQPHITVQGDGEAAVAPDMAILTLAVMREAETARAALDADNTAMAAVIAAMKEDGIAARDLQTSGLSIAPQYVYPTDDKGTQTQRLVGYQVTNTLTVRVRDLASMGKVIDRSVSLGVNQGGGISFTNDDPSAALTEARRKAVEDAMQRATTLADAAGVGLGDILEIAEQSSPGGPSPVPERMYRMAADAVPVEAGENTYRVQVNVTFGLERKQ